MSNNISEPLDRTCAGRILPEGKVNPYLIVIGGVFRKNSPKVFCVEHDQMIRALAPIEPIKRSAYPFCHGERNDVAGPGCPLPAREL
jgi:hypothetical protein